MKSLEDINKETPFSVPKNYWSKLEAEIREEVSFLESEEKLKSLVGTKTPFSVSPTYFNDFKTKKETVFPWWSLLAAACVVPLFLFLLNVNTENKNLSYLPVNNHLVQQEINEVQLAYVEEILIRDLSVSDLENYLIYEDFSVPSAAEMEQETKAVTLKLPSDISDNDILDYMEEEVDVEFLIDEL